MDLTPAELEEYAKLNPKYGHVWRMTRARNIVARRERRAAKCRAIKALVQRGPNEELKSLWLRDQVSDHQS